MDIRHLVNDRRTIARRTPGANLISSENQWVDDRQPVIGMAKHLIQRVFLALNPASAVPEIGINSWPLDPMRPIPARSSGVICRSSDIWSSCGSRWKF